jgi:hypothetical protein
MIKIERTNLDEIAKKYEKRIEDSVVKNKLDKIPFCNNNELQKLIREIYLCLPSNLENKNIEFKCFLDSNYPPARIKEIKSNYFDYEYIIIKEKDRQSHGSWLAKQLNVNVCPYCNRQYTFTIEENDEKKLTLF